MKQKIAKVLAISSACFLFSSFLFAQDSKQISAATNPYLISAKAGGVNFVSGKVAVVRRKGKNGYLLRGDTLGAGDKVLTGSSGRAEILLNPGSFVRLGGNSEFEFITTSLDDLQLKINLGSAILEVITADEFRVAVRTPKSSFFIAKSGIYRIDTLNDGAAKIEVWKGKAQVADVKATVLKGGQRTIINNEQVAVEKFDRDEKDEFVLWSRERAKELDKINAKLRAREMNQALMASYSQNGWNAYNSFGLWVRDPFSQSYCFLPFGYGWSSPYGHGYNRSIWNYLPANNNIMNQMNPYGNMMNGQQPMNPPYQNLPQGNGNLPTLVNPPVTSEPARAQPPSGSEIRNEQRSLPEGPRSVTNARDQ